MARDACDAVAIKHAPGKNVIASRFFPWFSGVRRANDSSLEHDIALTFAVDLLDGIDSSASLLGHDTFLPLLFLSCTHSPTTNPHISPWTDSLHSTGTVWARASSNVLPLYPARLSTRPLARTSKHRISSTSCLVPVSLVPRPQP